jgi:hypothetical protein
VQAVTVLSESQLEPVAVEIHATPARRDAPPCSRLLVRFAGAPAATAAQAAQARALVATGEVITGEPETAAWRRYVARSSASADTMVRINWLPAKLPQVLALIDGLAGANRSVELIGRAAGAGLVRLEGSVEWQASVVEQLRTQPDVVTHVTLRDASLEVKQQVDVWGPLGAAGTLGTAVKQALDPAGILNAGRGPI